MMKKPKKIAFIGTGIMGKRMAGRLAAAGHDLTVWNRTTEKAESLAKQGCEIAESGAEAVIGKEIVFTMLSTPDVIEELAFGENGIVDEMESGSIWINTSTVDPKSAKEFAKQSIEKGVRYLDAPVAGTKKPAEKGELTILVGGPEQDVEESEPLLSILGSRIVHLGDVGNASSMKLLINLMLAQSMVAFAETAQLGRAMGFEPAMVHNVLLNAPVSAPFLKNLKDKLETLNTEPNFPLKWIYKDLALTTQTAYGLDQPMPLANLTKELFAFAKQLGNGDEDFSSIYHVFENGG